MYLAITILSVELVFAILITQDLSIEPHVRQQK
jgi:hypothetical protein